MRNKDKETRQVGIVVVRMGFVCRPPATYLRHEVPKAGSRLLAATGKKDIDSVVQFLGATRYGESNYS